MTTARCTCGQPVIWAEDTVTGRLIPVDKDSAGDPHGDLAVSYRDRVLVSRDLSGGGQLRPREKRGTCHWRTCTNRKNDCWPRGRGSRNRDGPSSEGHGRRPLAQAPGYQHSPGRFVYL